MPIALSYSRWEVYQQCPARFHKMFIQKVPTPTPLAFEVGRVAHKVLEDYIKHCVATGRSTDWEMLAAIQRGHLAKARLEVAIEAEAALAGARDFLVPEGESHRVEEDIALTANWERCGWLDSKVAWRGKLDFHYVDHGRVSVVIDHKTDRRIWGWEELKRSEQLPIYAFLLARTTPHETFVACLHFSRYGVTRDIGVPYTRDRLTWVRDRLEAALKTVNADTTFEPKLGLHCGLCDYTATCPAFQRALKLGSAPVLTAPAEAQVEARRLSLLRKAADDAEARLRSWADLHGSIAVDDRQLGYLPKTTRSYEAAEPVVTALLKAGVPRAVVWGLVSISKTKVEQLCRELGRPELAKTLEALLTEEVRTELRWSGRSEGGES